MKRCGHLAQLRSTVSWHASPFSPDHSGARRPASLPDNQDELIKQYTFTASDLAVILRRRRPSAKLGFTVHLCDMRFPGVLLGAEEIPLPALLRYAADQLQVPAEGWKVHGQRPQARWEQLVELQSAFGFQTFSSKDHYREAEQSLDDVGRQTDRSNVLATELI